MVSYVQAHVRIARLRGRARMYRCHGCDQQARDWAYLDTTGTGYQVMDRGRMKRISEDPQDYLPLCQSCHQILDRGDRADATQASRDKSAAKAQQLRSHPATTYVAPVRRSPARRPRPRARRVRPPAPADPEPYELTADDLALIAEARRAFQTDHRYLLEILKAKRA